MKENPLKIFTIFFILGILIIPFDSAAADGASRPYLDVLTTIHNLNSVLYFLDEMLLDHPEIFMVMPSVLMEGVLQGTEWIDPDRQIAIGFKYRSNPPDIFILIPFLFEHQAFSDIYDATIVNDSYLITLPPGQAEAINRAVESELLNASLSPPKGDFHSVFQTGRMFQADDERSVAFHTYPLDLASIAKQTETASLGFRIGTSDLRFSVKLLPLKNSDLFKLVSSFNKSASWTSSADYIPAHPFLLQTTPFDLPTFFRLLRSSIVGENRLKDSEFERFSEILHHFSGEAIVGFSIKNGRLDFEAITVLNDATPSSDFLETTVMPWFLKWEGVFKRGEDSVVAGRKVVGIHPQAPLMQPFPFHSESHPYRALNIPEVRMTGIDRFLLVAPSDDRLNKLMGQIGSTKTEASNRPGAFFSADTEALTIAIIPPEALQKDNPTDSNLSGIRIQSDVVNGTSIINADIPKEDLKYLISNMMHILSFQNKTLQEPGGRETPNKTDPNIQKPRIDKPN